MYTVAEEASVPSPGDALQDTVQDRLRIQAGDADATPAASDAATSESSNHPPPIHSINSDILIEIFHLVASMDPTAQVYTHLIQDPHVLEDWKVTKKTLGWIRITHVCRRWREVAITDASLWAMVVCSFPSAFMTCLERARDAALTIECKDKSYYYSPTDLHDFCIHLLRQEPDRIKKFYLDTSSRRSWSTQFLGVKATNLASLTLYAPFSRSKDGETLSYPSKPFVAPLLEHLSVKSTFFPFRACSLRELDLVVPRFDTPPPDLLSILASSPLLEKITLVASQPLSGDYPDKAPVIDYSLKETVESLPTVHLPHLKRFHLKGAGFYILGCLKFPVGADVHLTIARQEDAPFSIIREVLHPHMWLDYDVLTIGSSADAHVRGGAFSLSYSDPSKRARLEVRSYPWSSMGVNVVYEYLSDLIDPSSVRKLDVIDAVFNTRADGIPFRAMAHFATAVFTRLTRTGFLRPDSDDEAPSDADSSVLFPSLQYLKVLIPAQIDGGNAEYKTCWLRLADALRARAAAGFPVHKLEVVLHKGALPKYYGQGPGNPFIPRTVVEDDDAIEAVRPHVTEFIYERVPPALPGSDEANFTLPTLAQILNGGNANLQFMFNGALQGWVFNQGPNNVQDIAQDHAQDNT